MATVVSQSAVQWPAAAWPVIWRAGLACGALDISAAFITWGVKGVTPDRVLRGIASGLLGPRSFTGGVPTAALGVVCHFFIASSAATVFYAASRRFTFLTERAVVSGIVYGVAVYLVMYWIVVPLSRVHRAPFSISTTVVAIATHIVCVGLPIALVVRRYST
jgi:hypothetical protein